MNRLSELFLLEAWDVGGLRRDATNSEVMYLSDRLWIHVVGHQHLEELFQSPHRCIECNWYRSYIFSTYGTTRLSKIFFGLQKRRNGTTLGTKSTYGTGIISIIFLLCTKLVCNSKFDVGTGGVYWLECWGFERSLGKVWVIWTPNFRQNV